MRWWLPIALILAGCGSAQRTGMSAADARSMIAGYIPSSVADREGWATDIHTAGGTQDSRHARQHLRHRLGHRAGERLSRPYPYPVLETLRDEVFTRCGGMYFGIAHLLDYPAPYERYLYRYADYNAGHYASRNAAFQAALAMVTGAKLALDGDLVIPRIATPGATETAARAIAQQVGLGLAEIRRDLEAGSRQDFETTTLYRRVFEIADARNGRPVARAVVPAIELQSPKFTRRLTTQWFAERVVQRHRQCLARGKVVTGDASFLPWTY